MIPHFADWGLELSPDVLPDMAPGEIREVILTVTPPAALPWDGDPIVDVEAFVDGELIGGCDITLEMHANGDLQKMVKEAAKKWPAEDQG